MGRKHWPGCNGNHPITAGCNGGYGERVKERLAADLEAARQEEYTQWEAELMRFAVTISPWVINRGGWEHLDVWEKEFLAVQYVNTGRFWYERIGPHANTGHMSIPDGWLDSIKQDDQSGD